jgi:hypothetical protein
MKGKFIPLLVPFREHEEFIPAKNQALKILSEAENILKENTCIKTGITYSANYDQTKSINKTYASGKTLTGISGANQAQVMIELERLLQTDYTYLQGSFRIVPITTMAYSDFDGFSHDAVIRSDLKSLEELLQNGWCIFGWMNQQTAPQFAVGGGIASLPNDLKELIQQTLTIFSETYR